jgi:hypothetical protein
MTTPLQNSSARSIAEAIDKGRTVMLGKYILALFLLPLMSSPGLAQTINSDDIDRAFEQQFGPIKERCDDRTFLRRMMLDIEGCIPSLKELQDFVQDKALNKRSKAIEKSLKSARSANFLGRRMADRLLEESSNQIVRQLMTNWSIKTIAANRSFKDVAAQLISIEGEATRDFAALFLLQYQGDAAAAATAVARQFLGASIDCAGCHDHPFADWKQSQFHEFAASFGRLRVRRLPGSQRRFELYESPIGDYRFKLNNSELSKTFQPRALDGTDLSAQPKRRKALAKWLTAGPEGGAQSYFVRAQVNRVFEQLFGLPLIGDVTDIGAVSDDPGLIKLLSRALVEKSFRLRSLRQLILQTRAYQRKHERPATPKEVPNAALPRLHRPLAADQIAASFLVATGRDKPAPGELKFLHDAMKKAMTSDFNKLAKSGPANQPFGSSVRQALRLINGEAFNGLIKDAEGRVLSTLLKNKAAHQQRITELCLRVLGRPPHSKEMTRWLAFVKAVKTQEKKRYEDLYWALLASTEFNCQR